MNVAGNLSLGVPKHTRLLLNLALPGDWVHRAACAGADTDMWFREAHDTTSYREARAICGTCHVTRECLDWALATRTDHGVFGGLTPKQRKHLRRSA